MKLKDYYVDVQGMQVFKARPAPPASRASESRVLTWCRVAEMAGAAAGSLLPKPDIAEGYLQRA